MFPFRRSRLRPIAGGITPGTDRRRCGPTGEIGTSAVTALDRVRAVGRIIGMACRRPQPWRWCSPCSRSCSSIRRPCLTRFPDFSANAYPGSAARGRRAPRRGDCQPAHDDRGRGLHPHRLVAASFPPQLPWLPLLAPAGFGIYVLATRPFPADRVSGCVNEVLRETNRPAIPVRTFDKRRSTRSWYVICGENRDHRRRSAAPPVAARVKPFRHCTIHPPTVSANPTLG